MAGTSVLKVGQVGGGNGGTLEFWTFSLDPASIAAAAQGIETVEIPGARAGDVCFAQPQVPEAELVPQGATVTDDDEVSIYIANNITVTTAFNGGAKVWNLQIFKRAISPSIP